MEHGCHGSNGFTQILPSTLSCTKDLMDVRSVKCIVLWIEEVTPAYGGRYGTRMSRIKWIYTDITFKLSLAEDP